MFVNLDVKTTGSQRNLPKTTMCRFTDMTAMNMNTVIVKREESLDRMFTFSV
jgi:hypothetical protein